MTETVEEKKPVEIAAKESKVWKHKLEAEELQKFEEAIPESFSKKSTELNLEELLFETKGQIYRQFKGQQQIILQGKSFKDYIANKYQISTEEKIEEFEIRVIKNYLQSKIVDYITENSDAALVKAWEQNSSKQNDLKVLIANQQQSIEKLTNEIESLDSNLSNLKEALIKTKALLRSLKKYQQCFVDPLLIEQLKSMLGKPIESKELLSNLRELIGLEHLEKQPADLEESGALLERAILSLELMKQKQEIQKDTLIKKYQLDEEMLSDKEKVLNQIKELSAKELEFQQKSPELEELDATIINKTNEEFEQKYSLEELLSSLNKLKLEEKKLQEQVIDELFEKYFSEVHQADDNQRAAMFNDFILQEALLDDYTKFIEETFNSTLDRRETESKEMKKLVFFALYFQEGNYGQVAKRIIEENNLDNFAEKGFNKQTTYSVSLNEDGTVDHTAKVEFRNTTETSEDKFISITTTVNVKYEYTESDNGATVSFTPKLKNCEVKADSGTAEELSQLEKDNDPQLLVVEAVVQPAVHPEEFSTEKVSRKRRDRYEETVVEVGGSNLAAGKNRRTLENVMSAGTKQQDVNSSLSAFIWQPIGFGQSARAIEKRPVMQPVEVVTTSNNKEELQLTRYVDPIKLAVEQSQKQQNFMGLKVLTIVAKKLFSINENDNLFKAMAFVAQQKVKRAYEFFISLLTKSATDTSKKCIDFKQSAKPVEGLKSNSHLTVMEKLLQEKDSEKQAIHQEKEDHLQLKIDVEKEETETEKEIKEKTVDDTARKIEKPEKTADYYIYAYRRNL